MRHGALIHLMPGHYDVHTLPTHCQQFPVFLNAEATSLGWDLTKNLKIIGIGELATYLLTRTINNRGYNFFYTLS